MQHDTFRNLWRTLEDASADITRACRRVLSAIAVMSWPAIAVCCVLLALVISLLPLALFLFILFMGIKIVVGAFVIDSRRDPAPRYKD